MPLSSDAQVKPALLELFERYYIPLGLQAVPCLPGLVLALLTAMEDLGSDVYRRALKLLDKLAASTGIESFMRAVWGRLLHNASVRYQDRHPLAHGIDCDVNCKATP